MTIYYSGSVKLLDRWCLWTWSDSRGFTIWLGTKSGIEFIDCSKENFWKQEKGKHWKTFRKSRKCF